MWGGHSCPLLLILTLTLSSLESPEIKFKIKIKSSGQECPLYTEH
jgi:hypothetical protein